MTVADQALETARRAPPLSVVVVHPTKAGIIDAVHEAWEQTLIEPILVGPRDRVEAAAQEAGIDISSFKLIETEHSHASAAKGAELALSPDVDALMKGSLHTSELLQGVLAEKGLRTELRMSHVYVLESPDYPKPFMITDGGINIAPDLETKRHIAQNAANLFCALTGGERPAKIAALAAVETVVPAMPVTVDAAALAKMSDRGQITHAIVDGPLAFDNAISKKAAETKGIHSSVAGDPDVLLVPDLEAGNLLAKQMTFMGGADAAAVVLGAKKPIILPSRADSQRTRLLSCALAGRLVSARKEGTIK